MESEEIKEYSRGDLPKGNWKSYEKVLRIRALRINEPFKVRVRGAVISGSPGDYLIVDDKGQISRVEGEFFSMAGYKLSDDYGKPQEEREVEIPIRVVEERVTNYKIYMKD